MRAADGRPSSSELIIAVLHHSRSTGAARSILIGLAYQSGHGSAWPSLTTLATYGNVGRRGAIKAIAQLKQLDEVRVHVHGGGFADDKFKRGRRPNRYEVLVRCTPWCQAGKHRDDEPPDTPLWMT